jgi:hypothetical protein
MITQVGWFPSSEECWSRVLEPPDALLVKAPLAWPSNHAVLLRQVLELILPLSQGSKSPVETSMFHALDLLVQFFESVGLSQTKVLWYGFRKKKRSVSRRLKIGSDTRRARATGPSTGLRYVHSV